MDLRDKARKEALKKKAKWSARGKSSGEVMRHHRKEQAEKARKDQGVYIESGKEKRKSFFDKMAERFKKRKK